MQSSAMVWNKEAKYIWGQRKGTSKSCQKSPLVQSTLLQPAFKKAPSLVFDLVLFFFLGKIKPVRIRPFYPLSFLLKHNPNITEFPVTRNWAVLDCRSFCLLLWRTCSFSRNFCSNGAISRKKATKILLSKWERLLKK